MEKYVPPYIESRFEYKGYPCVVLFQKLCHRCGYVGIPPEHCYYNVDYNEMDITCHGGLTYGSDTLPNTDEEDGYHWIGFDCAHGLDEEDYESGLLYFKDEPEIIESITRRKEFDKKFDAVHGYSGDNSWRGQIRDLAYVEDQCRYIVEQLEEANK